MDPLLINFLTAVLGFLLSALTPLITFLFTSRHERKMYELKFLSEHKVRAVESYLENIGRYIFVEQTTDSSISEGLSVIFVYAPSELWSQIEAMNQTVAQISSARDYDARRDLRDRARPQYLELCRSFSVIRKEMNFQGNSQKRRSQ